MSETSAMTQRTAKALIAQFTGQANMLTIPRVFITMTGSLEAALVLSQSLYWSERTSDPDGWFWKRAEDWMQELSLSEYQVRKARKILAPFGLETKLRTLNNTPTLYYRIDGDQLYKCILQFLQNASCENCEMHSAKTAGSTYTEITDKDHNTERESAPAGGNLPTSVSATTTPGKAIKPAPIKQTALPAAYPLTEEMRVWARMDVPDLGERIDTEHKKFCNHYRSKGERRADWRPMWENWMMRAVEDFAPKPQKGSVTNGYESRTERNERILRARVARWQTDLAAGDADHEEPLRLPTRSAG